MAKKIVREIVIDAQTKEAIKNMDKLGQTFEQVFNTANEGIKPLTTQIGELEDAMYALAAAGQSNSQEFKDLQTKVGQYKKVIIDTDLAIDAMAGTTAQNLGGAIEGVSGAFAIGTGVMGTFGVESEAVEEMLLRVQSAMAITQGINSVREGIKAFSGLKAAIMASTVVQRILNVVMTANPIGLIVAGIGALIAGVMLLMKPIQDLYNWFVGTDDVAEQAAATTHELAVAQAEVNRELDRAISKLEKLRDEQQTAHDQRIRQLKLEGASIKEITDAEEQKAKDNLKNTQDQIKEVEKAIEKQIVIEQKADEHKQKLFEENMYTEEAAAAMVEANKAFTALQISKDKLKKLKSQEIDHQQDLTQITQDGQAERLARWKAYQAKKQQAEANRLAAARAIEDAEQKLKAQDRETELENIRIANARKIEDLKLNKNLEKNERLALEKLALEELAKQELEINAKYDAIKDEKEKAENQKRIDKIDAQHKLEVELIKDNQERELQLLIESYDAKFAIAEGNAELEKQLTDKLNSEILAINKKYNEEEIAENKKKEDKKKADREAAIAGVGNALSALGGLSQAITDAELAKAGDDEAKKERIRKKAFERDKKIQLATAIVTGIQSVMSAYQSGSALPVIGIVMGPLMAAIAAATAAMNIKKIKNTKYESASPTTGSVPTSASAASATSTPMFNIAGNSPENQLAQTLGQDQQPVKAFVVAGDVTTAQSMERDKVELSGI
tara:strand:+ start:35 stop:2230 length:2196 start_codon:yes stop_codon:yes gene_type:complete